VEPTPNRETLAAPSAWSRLTNGPPPTSQQATRFHSATKSGIDILPFMLGVVFASGIAGGLISKIGYYWPFLLFGPVFSCIGSGLLYTVDENTPSANLIGYQIVRTMLFSDFGRRQLTLESPRSQLLGVGVGCVLQNTLIAVQADCKDETEVPQRTAIVTFGQLGALSVPPQARQCSHD